MIDKKTKENRYKHIGKEASWMKKKERLVLFKEAYEDLYVRMKLIYLV